MSKEKRRVPKLRFPGFTEDWEQRKLGDVIASLYNGQTPSRFDKANWEGDIPWLTSGELNRGVVNHSIEKITQQGRDDANLKIVPKGTVVIAITGLEAAGTRGNCAKLGFDTTLNQSCMAIYPKSEFLDPDFLFQWYIAVGEEYGIKYTQGTKQQSYNAELIKILPISVPRVTEQRKITRILDLFDDIITLHQRKLDNLKLKKKALLQKLFPKNGERYPELRFPGFTDAWEQRKLGDYLSIPEREVLEVKSANDLLTVKLNLGGVELGANRDTLSLGSTVYYKRYAGQFIYGKQNFFNGSMGIISQNLDGKGSSGDVPSFNILNIETNYLYTYVSRESYWRPKVAAASGTGSKRIHEKTLLDFNIDVPSINEQKLISNTFDLINRFITLHQRKLDHLQLQKKALLQQMFV